MESQGEFMRAGCFLIPWLIAACSSSSPPDSTPDRFITLSCEASLVGYCPGGRDCTLDEAEHDAALCQLGRTPSVVSCGDYVIVFENGIDDGMAHYYRDGELIALDAYVLSKHHCSATSDSLEAPQCDHATGAPLPACQ
jgi:hypothetical protein